MVTLRQPLTRAECQQVREWRNDPDVQATLRAKRLLTEAEQEQFYREVICDPTSERRYYAILLHGTFVGVGSLCGQEEAEIGLLLAPFVRGCGVGTDAVSALLEEAFGRLRLRAVFGECLETGPVQFWARQVMHRPAALRWTWHA